MNHDNIDTMRYAFNHHYYGNNADYLDPPTVFLKRKNMESQRKMAAQMARYARIDEEVFMTLYNEMYRKNTPKQKAMSRIINVIFKDPATIVFWADGTKTVVKAIDEPFDPEKGLAMAISKKFFDNRGYYCDVFKQWLPKKETKDDIKFVSLKEYCAMKNITKNKAYKMIKRDEIYAFKNGRGLWQVWLVEADSDDK